METSNTMYQFVGQINCESHKEGVKFAEWFRETMLEYRLKKYKQKWFSNQNMSYRSAPHKDAEWQVKGMQKQYQYQ